MTLEVRELLLKSTVGDGEEGVDTERHDQSGSVNTVDKVLADQARLREEILAECRTWLMAHLHDLRER